MSRFYITLFIIFLSSSNTGAASAYPEIKISIVDSDNNAFRAETVRWWYAGKRDKKYELKCINDQCDKRFLKESWVGSIVISASTSIVFPDDASCWKLYQGEVSLDSPAQGIVIVMRYKNTFCR